MEKYQSIVNRVADTLVRAGSTFLSDKKEAYRRAIEREVSEDGRWVMETVLENAEIAEQNQTPLCDDTGIPHLILEVGKSAVVSGNMLVAIEEGVRQGLRRLPGRPMAVLGNDAERLDQSRGLAEDPAALCPAPILLRRIEEPVIRLYVLMFGGGPAIRGRTYRVFHKHNVKNILDEIVSWAVEGTTLLGCTPCTLAVGIGRSQYEASAMMLMALTEGRYDRQSVMEQEITDRVNAQGAGTLGLGGNTTVLATFMKVGPQRASGVRVVSLRPCCCFEPRIASVILSSEEIQDE